MPPLRNERARPPITQHRRTTSERGRVIGIAAAVFCLVALAAARDSRADWFSIASVSAVYDDNLSRAAEPGDRKADIALAPSLTAGRYRQIGGTTGLSAALDLRDVTYARYDGLNNIDAGLTVSIKRKAGLGTYVPWLRLFGSMAYNDYREGMRSGLLLSTGLDAGKRLDERVFAQIGLAYEDGRARNDVFDEWGSTVSFKGTYLLSETMQLQLGASTRKGTSVMDEAAAPGSPAAYSEVEVDTFTTPMIAYQVRTRTNTVSAGLQKVLDAGWSADGRVEYRETWGDGERYPDTVASIGLTYSY